MVCKSLESSRRILSFPVVRPCESVASSTLLASVIDLGRTICIYKSATLYSNKKNVRNSICLIETLVFLLEEIRKGDLGFEDSLNLSLSELHCIFQKVLFLLEDCTRDDARMLMLVRSEKVSSSFMEAMRGVSVVMDVIRLEGMDFEVKELAEFVRKRVLMAKVEVDRVDRRFTRKVLGVLSKFERAISPDSVDLRSVFEYLQIRSWADCHKQVKFLESEIEQECLSADKRDFEFLSSLKAFLVFCRCSLFQTMDCVSHVLLQSNGSPNGAVICGLNFDDFLCPITLEIMSDPVTISTGHTYDRSSILKWFRSGNRTCPKTGKRVFCTDLIPNLSLKRLAKEYTSANGIPFSESDSSDPDRTPNPCLNESGSSAAADGAVSLLAEFLAGKLVAGTIQEKVKAAYEIRLLTKSSAYNRSCFVEIQATIPSLLNLLSLGNAAAQENAMAALLNLSKHGETKTILVQNEGLNLVVDVLKDGLKIEARQYAAGALFYLSSVEDYRKKIGRIPGAIPGLVYLLKIGGERGKKNALLAIWLLLLCPENHLKLLENGVVPLLIDVFTSSEMERLKAHSLAALAALAETLEGSMAVIRARSVPEITAVLESSDSARSAKEHCVSLLLSLCINAEADVVPVLARNSSIIVTLYSILAHGSGPSSNKAGSLIRILQSFNEKRSMAGTASALPQEQLVHVW